MGNKADEQACLDFAVKACLAQHGISKRIGLLLSGEDIQRDNDERPEFEALELDPTSYDTVFIGYPIWWDDAPRMMSTFVEAHEFDGKTVIPFCTSGGSGIGRSGPNMEALAGSGTWLEGKRFSGNVSEADLQTWIDGLK